MDLGDDQELVLQPLLDIENYGEGYARGVSRTFDMPLSEEQKQLAKFEEAGNPEAFLSRAKATTAKRQARLNGRHHQEL